MGVLWLWWVAGIKRACRACTRAATAYASGDLDAPVQAHGGRDMEALSNALTRMAQAIQAQMSMLTAQRNELIAIFESMVEGVLAVDRQGKILLVNSAAARFLGVSRESMLGQPLFSIVRHHELHALAHHVLEGGGQETKALTIFQPQERLLRVHGVPCSGAAPTEPAAVLVMEDITEHQRYEQLRKEFVANVSHELKSPLTAIRSLTETLLEGALEDPANNRRFVQLIDEDAARLSRLIDDLLALSQIESQAVPLALARVALKPLVESVIVSLRPTIAARRLSVDMQIAAGLNAHADPERLRQVLANLIDNAIKYNTDGGGLRIDALEESEELRMSVADTGMGIPPDDLPRIFERFYRVDKARSRELGGTGLGLSIVKHIVELHHGRVTVESRLGHGSTFTVILPR